MDLPDPLIVHAIIVEDRPLLQDPLLVLRVGEVRLRLHEHVVHPGSLLPPPVLVERDDMHDRSILDECLVLGADELFMHLEDPPDLRAVPEEERLRNEVALRFVRIQGKERGEKDIMLCPGQQLLQVRDHPDIQALVGIEHDEPVRAFAETFQSLVPG